MSHQREKVRSHRCGELRIEDVGSRVTLSGWVHKSRNLNHFCFIDLRDRYGITQIVVKQDDPLYKVALGCGREWVIRVKGEVVERSNKNKTRETGDIEVIPTSIEILNPSKTPPFTIEDNTDGLEDIRMKFRYLDIRRNPIRNNLVLRHKTGMAIRNYLTEAGFVEIETPVLIKSTPEGARDFVVPSRMNPGTFYALPQSPQTFKQLLMVGGIDRYFQIVKCFRDEELRADRQPEFTQIDCEMSFVNQAEVMTTFEGAIKHVFKEIIGVDLGEVPHMTWDDAMTFYGIDKPDLRFDMRFVDLTSLSKGKGFQVFDSAEIVIGICVRNVELTKKKIDEWTKLATSSGAKGMVWVKHEKNGSIKSGVSKFFKEPELRKWTEACSTNPGDCILILAGPTDATRVSMGRFRLALGTELKLRDPNVFKPLWVVDFPLLEWNEEEKRWNAMHHPFTSPYLEHLHLLECDPGKVRARAYDLVINGIEVGGGSIRIHNRQLQMKMLNVLGFTPERAEEQFGFLMRAFEYGAPPHGGLAFGFDRLCCILGKEESIRPFIAFPKNKEGRDTMIDAPSPITEEQLNELSIKIVLPENQKEISKVSKMKENQTTRSIEHPTLANWRDSPYSTWSFRNVREIIPTASIACDRSKISPLGCELNDKIISLSFVRPSTKEKVSIKDFLEQTFTDTFLVVKDGKIVFEWNADGASSTHPHILMSVSKSIMGLLAGALQAASLLDLDAPVVKYVPEVAKGAFGEVTVRHLLDMQVSYNYVEDYPDLVGEPFKQYMRSVGWFPSPFGHMGIQEYLKTRETVGEHGKCMLYLSPTADMLGWVCQAASGMSLAEALSKYIWKPMGAESDAYITLDNYGHPVATGGVNATPRDTARLGMIVANDGAGVVPKSFIDDLCRKGSKDHWINGSFGPVFPNGNYRSFWYQVGVDQPDVVFGLGIHGQMVFVDRPRKVVVVKTSRWNHPSVPGWHAEAVEASAAVAHFLDNK